ncbi:trigger factor [Patescibacteria group bacterium]
MKVTKKELPKSQVELTIELSVDEVKPHVEAAAKEIAKQVEIKGFRKGKVPYDVLAKNVGEQSIYEEAFNAMVEATYPKAVEQEKLEVIGKVQIDVDKMAPGNPVVYRATVPLMPKMTLGDYKSLKSKKKVEPVDEKKFESTLEDLRRMRAKEKLVDRAAKNEDKVIVDFDVKVAGVSIEGGQGSEQGMVLGGNQFIPGFEENIVGMKKDEEKDFDVKFPDDYHKKDLGGKKATVHVKLHNVYEIELPEVTDEVAKEMNFDTAEHLKKELRANLEREAEQRAHEHFEAEVLEEIMASSEFDELPDQIIDDEAQKMLSEIKHEVMQQGLKFEDYLQHMNKKEEELLKDFREKAEKRIKAALIMREVAVAEDIKVERAEIDKELEEMKKLYEQVPDMAHQIDSPEQRARMENMMMHKKTFEKLESYTK